MAKISVLNWQSKKVGEVEVPAEVIDSEVRKDILQAVVKWQLACRRQGNASTKTKGLVSGGGKKPFKQKGTGEARQGSTRSPLMPGGGTAFGPAPRDYSYVLPKKVKQAGLRSALSYLNKSGKFFVVDQMDSEGKAAELAKRLKQFGSEKSLLVDENVNDLFKRASGNLKNYKYISAEGLNVFDLLKYDSVIVTKKSLDKIVSRCGMGN